MSQVDTFVVAAWPAAGKSVATAEISVALNRAGFHVNNFSDKQYLLQEVKLEIINEGKSLQSSSPIEVTNFTLLNPLEDYQSWGIRFKNSATLNEAHRKMIDAIGNSQWQPDGNTKNVVEIAYGENASYPDGNLRQTATDFLDQFKERGILERSAWVDVYSRLIFRSPRNEGRKLTIGYIPKDQFELYFKDIGGFTKEDVARLGSRYKQIKNEFIPEWYYRRMVRDTVEKFMLPFMRQEGQFMASESHRRAGRYEL